MVVGKRTDATSAAVVHSGKFIVLTQLAIVERDWFSLFSNTGPRCLDLQVLNSLIRSEIVFHYNCVLFVLKGNDNLAIFEFLFQTIVESGENSVYLFFLLLTHETRVSEDDRKVGEEHVCANNPKQPVQTCLRVELG